MNWPVGVCKPSGMSVKCVKEKVALYFNIQCMHMNMLYTHLCKKKLSNQIPKMKLLPLGREMGFNLYLYCQCVKAKCSISVQSQQFLFNLKWQ